MNFKRMGRVLVCLLLICCLTFHAMIPKAEASSIGAAATIVKASTVTCNPYIIAGATLIALGVYAGVETGAFETVANNCVDTLEAAGTWVKDGVVELLRTEDADGNASYYVDSGFMEDVRSYVAEDVSYIQNHPDMIIASDGTQLFKLSNRYYKGSNLRVYKFVYLQGFQVCVFVHVFCDDACLQWGTKTNGNFYDYSSNVLTSSTSHSTDESNYQSYLSEYLSKGYVLVDSYIDASELKNGQYSSLDFPLDVSLGVFPSVPVDGTSARQWSEDYTDRGLKVYGGGSGNNNNDGKWFWPLALTLTAAELYAMSQADQWAAQTPAEFEDYTEVEELEIVSRPEVDFAQGVELAPVTAPDTGGDTGSDTGSESGNQTDYTSWFQKIIKGIEELPSKFESWISDCKTAIEEIPSKFADWFNSIIEKLSSIWETLKSIPQLIIDGFRQLLSDLFVPGPDYIPNKVNALHEKFPYLDTFNELGTSLKDFLIGLGVSPPIIYIDLGAARNSYIWGGRQIFIDLTWYAEYKPTMDFIISAFLWLWFAFRLWQSLPGILQGTSGMWGSPDPYIGFHSWKDPQQKLGSGDGTIYSGPVSVPPERRLGWGRGRGFTERRK